MKTFGLVLSALALTPALVLTQGSAQFRERRNVITETGPWTGARLPDGQPDVQGFWSNTIGNHNNLTNPQGRNAELLEFKCVPFAEEILYGHLRKGYVEERTEESR